jgi:Rad3-related DNA helicase
MIEPREYQTEALTAVLRKRQEGVTRQLLSLPTGSGKTIIFGLLAKALNTKTLVLAHRDELLTQAVEKMRLIAPAADIGIFKAQEREGLERICIFQKRRHKMSRSKVNHKMYFSLVDCKRLAEGKRWRARGKTLCTTTHLLTKAWRANGGQSLILSILSNLNFTRHLPAIFPPYQVKIH